MTRQIQYSIDPNVSSYWDKIISGKTELSDQDSQLVSMIDQAWSNGIDYLRGVVKFVEENYPGFLPENIENGTEGGLNQYLIYNASRYLTVAKAIQSEQQALNLLKAAGVTSGHKLGTVVLNDTKQVRAVTVSSIDKLVINLVGTRGRNKVNVQLHPSNLVRAIIRGQPNSKLSEALNSGSPESAREIMYSKSTEPVPVISEHNNSPQASLF